MRLRLALLAVSSACSLYNGNGDDEAGTGAEPTESLISPFTNQCETFNLDVGSGSGIPAWAPCTSLCSALSEEACLITSVCHATYASTPAGTSFWTCDEIAVFTGDTTACSTVDANGCAERTDCAATFSESDANGPNPSWSFERCSPEVSHPGSGDPGTCDSSGVRCNSAPPQCPSDTVPGVLDACWSGYCIPVADCP
jgi:hypothetical protein